MLNDCYDGRDDIFLRSRHPRRLRIAQIGAAIGREFSHVLLSAVVSKPEAEILWAGEVTWGWITKSSNSEMCGCSVAGRCPTANLLIRRLAR